MTGILTAILSVTAIGAVLAVILSAASKVMAVEVDERLARVQEILPGSNCGACGYPGCAGYAEALIADKDLKQNLCSPGGPGVVKELNKILGGEGGEAEIKRAVVRCRGDVQQKKMDYIGIKTCAAAKQLSGGEGACAFGCLGYGDCKIACPSDAICIEHGLASININKYTGCGLCVKACPNHIISMETDPVKSVVLCANLEKGAVVRKKCAHGCIGCGKCSRECTSGAINLKDNLAVIDSEKCAACGHCAEICVTRSIKLFAQ